MIEPNNDENKFLEYTLQSNGLLLSLNEKQHYNYLRALKSNSECLRELNFRAKLYIVNKENLEHSLIPLMLTVIPERADMLPKM